MAIADPFEALADIDLPELQHTTNRSNIADGPFAVEFGNNLGLGAQLRILPNGWVTMLLNNGIKHFDPEQWEVEVNTARQTITFTGRGGGIDYVLRPLTLGDQKHFFPHLRFSSLSEYKDLVAEMAYRIYGSQADLTDYAITVDNDRVLGLFRHKDGGGTFRREGGEWVKITRDDADWADIEDKQWVTVLSGAIGVFDKYGDDDVVSTSLFKSFIL